jgi:hypothetical protein
MGQIIGNIRVSNGVNAPLVNMKRQLKISAVVLAVLVALGSWVALFSARAQALAMASIQKPLLPVTKPVQPPAAVPTVVPIAKAPVPVSGNIGELDERHQYALGMIETGNKDGEIGGAGEVSRYQIMPSVWRHYSDSLNYRNPQVSFTVARRHWANLYASFKQHTHREPTDFDMYVLWNTHYGYYASRNFDPDRLAPSVRDRAQRYVNLVQDGDI